LLSLLMIYSIVIARPSAVGGGEAIWVGRNPQPGLPRRPDEIGTPRNDTFEVSFLDSDSGAG